jgi:hypothetical protein
MRFDKRMMIFGALLTASTAVVAQYRVDVDTAKGVRSIHEGKTLDGVTLHRNAACKMNEAMKGAIVETASGKTTPFDCRTVLQQLQQEREARK